MTEVRTGAGQVRELTCGLHEQHVQRDVGERIHKGTGEGADEGIHKETGDKCRIGKVTSVGQVTGSTGKPHSRP